MASRAITAFGIIGVLCLIISVCILKNVSTRSADIEAQQNNLANTLGEALDKYTTVLRVIERRQTHIENLFIAEQQLYLTIEQLKAHNRFHAPQTAFTRTKKPQKGIGGR